MMTIIGVYYEFRCEDKFVVVADSDYSDLTDILERYGVQSAMIAENEIETQSLPFNDLMRAAEPSQGDREFFEEAYEKLLDYLLGDQSNNLDKAIFYGEGE